MRSLRIFAVPAVLALCACGETGKLRVDGELGKTSAALGSEDGSSLELADGKLVITSASVRVSEIELEGGTEDDELEAELGSGVIRLALDGGPTTVVSDQVDAGSYHTLGLELRGGKGGILVKGTYDEVPFTFDSGLSPELEFPLDPEVVVPPDGQTSVAVTFDLAAWFGDPAGDVLDPSDPGNQGAIEQRVLASMAAHAAIEAEDDEDDD
jgi:hypothetical protein